MSCFDRATGYYRIRISQVEDDIIVTSGNLGGNVYVWDHFSDEPRYGFDDAAKTAK